MPSLPIAFMNHLVVFLMPFFLGFTHDQDTARSEILETLASYGARTRSEFLSAAQIIAFSLSAIDTLSEAKAVELSATMRLRARGCANSLNRAGQQNETTLAKRLACDPVACGQVAADEPAPEAIIDATEAQVQETLQQARASIDAIQAKRPTSPATDQSPRSPADQQERNRKLWGTAMMDALAGMGMPVQSVPPDAAGSQSVNRPTPR